MKPYIHWFYASVAIVTLSQSAVSQQQTGTVIVFRFSRDHAVVAGDSRAIRDCGITKIRSEDVCKILAFDNKYVFAAAGYSGRFNPCTSDHALWNVRDITKDLYRDGGISSVGDFARKWATKMSAVLAKDAKISPPPMNGPERFILSGLFIGNINHKLTAALVKFQASGGSLLILGPSKDYSAFGAGGVLDEFDAKQTCRAMKWHCRIDKLTPDAQVPALAELARDNDTSGLIGGSIDAIQINQSEIKWIAVKKQCDSK